MGGSTMAHVTSWLLLVFVVFFQDVEAQDKITTPSPTATPPPPPPSPVQPIVIFGPNTYKDIQKGEMPWNAIPRGMPFNPINHKYNPYILIPPPQQWYPPNFRKHFNKDWDPPKNKDIPKSKTDDKKIENSIDRNYVTDFFRLPDMCRDADNKLLDDKAGCKGKRSHSPWRYQGPVRDNYCWGGRCEPQRRPWQSYSFFGGSSSVQNFPSGSPEISSYIYPNYPIKSVAPESSQNKFVPNPYSNFPLYNYQKPYKYYPYSYHYPYPSYHYHYPSYPSYPYPSYPYSYPYIITKKFIIPLSKSGNNPVFAKVDTEAPGQQPDAKKQEPSPESVKDKPEKSKAVEEPKKIKREPKFMPLKKQPLILP